SATQSDRRVAVTARYLHAANRRRLAHLELLPFRPLRLASLALGTTAAESSGSAGSTSATSTSGETATRSRRTETAACARPATGTVEATSAAARAVTATGTTWTCPATTSSGPLRARRGTRNIAGIRSTPHALTRRERVVPRSWRPRNTHPLAGSEGIVTGPRARWLRCAGLR